MNTRGLKLSPRTHNIYKNIIFALPIKGGSAVLTLAMIPLLYNYLTEETYGIWIIIFTIFNWMGLFDLGLANGLKNRLVLALTKSDYILAREYVSTTYVAIGFMSISVFILLLIPNLFMSWSEVLNISNPELDLKYINILVCFFFAARFTHQILLSVLIAHQEVYKADLINLISSILVFILMLGLVLLEYKEGSLIAVIVINMLTPIVVLLAASIFLYQKQFKKISPSISFFKYEHLKDLLGLGLNFLWVQINGIILFQSSYLIISTQIGPAEVTIYSIIFNYFHSVPIVLNVFLNPYWPAVTEAVTNGDFYWIRKSLKNLRFLFLLFLSVSLGLYLLADIVIPIWIGQDFIIEGRIVLLMCLYTVLNMWRSIHSFFLNGMSQIKIQSILSSFTALGFLVLAFLLAKTHGLFGIVLANVLAGIPRALIYPYILNNKIR